MSDPDDLYRQTHTLLVGSPLVGTPTCDRIILESIRAGAAVADRLRVEVEAEWIEQDFSDVLDQLGEQLDRTRNGDITAYEGRATPDTAAALKPLLEMSGGEGQRVYGIRSVRLSADGSRCLEYVPEHRSFTIEADAADGLDATIRDTLADEPAGLLECRPLAEWEYEGTKYSVDPPWLCVGATCSRLSGLETIDSDSESRRIGLSWYESDRGRVGRAIGWIAEQVGMSKPTVLSFDSRESFESAQAALEEVVAITGCAQNYAA